MYISRYEAAAVTQILGTDTLPDGREIVVVNSGTRSFNRGHITPDADFVMDYQQVCHNTQKKYCLQRAKNYCVIDPR